MQREFNCYAVRRISHYACRLFLCTSLGQKHWFAWGNETFTLCTWQAEFEVWDREKDTQTVIILSIVL